MPKIARRTIDSLSSKAVRSSSVFGPLCLRNRRSTTRIAGR